MAGLAQRDALEPTSPSTERNPWSPVRHQNPVYKLFPRAPEKAGLSTRRDRKTERGSREAPLPDPHESRKVEQSLPLFAPSSAYRGQVASEGRRGRSAGRWQLTSVFQPVAELTALADPWLSFLIRLHRGAHRSRAGGGGGGRGRVAPRWRPRDSGSRGAAALAAQSRLHGAGLQIPRGEADHDGDKSPKCQGPRAPRESFNPTAVSGRSAASSASGGGWGRAVAAALRPREQVRAAGTRPKALSPGTRIDAPRRVEREGPGPSRRVEAEGTVRGRGDQPEASSGLGEGVTEDAPPTHVADWCPGGTPPP